MIWYSQPWRTDKNLVAYYNGFMDLIGENDWACFTDADAMFTTHGYGTQIEDYIKSFPDYSCFLGVTSRIGGERQKVEIGLEDDHDIKKHRIKGAQMMGWEKGPEDFTAPKPHHFSGVCMVLSKKAWEQVGGFRSYDGKSNILGIDTALHQDLFDAGLKSMIMNDVYLYHWYRGDGKGKGHLE